MGWLHIRTCVSSFVVSETTQPWHWSHTKNRLISFGLARTSPYKASYWSILNREIRIAFPLKVNSDSSFASCHRLSLFTSRVGTLLISLFNLDNRFYEGLAVSEQRKAYHCFLSASSNVTWHDPSSSSKHRHVALWKWGAATLFLSETSNDLY